jgi:hypothetical protein
MRPNPNYPGYRACNSHSRNSTIWSQRAVHCMGLRTNSRLCYAAHQLRQRLHPPAIIASNGLEVSFDPKYAGLRRDGHHHDTRSNFNAANGIDLSSHIYLGSKPRTRSKSIPYHDRMLASHAPFWDNQQRTPGRRHCSHPV